MSRAWILSDGKAGHLAMTTGVATALGAEAKVMEVAPSRLWRLIAPNGSQPTGIQEMLPAIGQEWPQFVLAAGRLTIPYLRAIRRSACGRSFTVALMDPRVSDAAELIWVPEHDGRRGDNVITTLTAPHSYSPERLRALSHDMPPKIAALPAPRVAVLVGGRGAGFAFKSADIARFVAALGDIAARGASFLITPSRRTPAALIDAVAEATAGAPRIIWDGTGENPYPYFLACADRFVVSADSVNMTGEACATGKPVHVFMPHGGRPKFHTFHRSLQEIGATRELREGPDTLEKWEYTPIHAASRIAEEIARRARPASA